MKILPPLDLSTLLTSSTASEPGAGETAWSSGATYALGDVRIRTGTHRKYECILAVSGSTTAPEDDATHWTDVGPTNKWAMLDSTRNTATTLASPLTVVITPARRINALALFGLVADEVEITVNDGSTDIYTETIDLATRYTTTWSEYFFGEFVYQESVVLVDLPPVSAPVITVAITRASGNVQCQTLAVGTAVEIGDTRMGAETDVLDFSKVTRDEFGSATLVPRKSVPVARMTVLLPKDKVNALRKLRKDNAAKPVVFIGMDDSADGYFDSVSMLGIYKRMTVVIEYPTHSLCTLELEGL